MEHIVNLNITQTLAEKPILLVNALRNLNVMTVVLAMKIVNNVPIVPMEHIVTFQETQGLTLVHFLVNAWMIIMNMKIAWIILMQNLTRYKVKMKTK